MSNAQELYQIANDLDKDELVTLLVEAQMKLDQSEKQRYEDNEKARGVITEVCNENKTLKEQKDKKIAYLDEELTLSNTALEMVKDENEVNKKNMRKFMEENKELKKKLGDMEHDFYYFGCLYHVSGQYETPSKDEVEDYLVTYVSEGDRERIRKDLWEEFDLKEE